MFNYYIAFIQRLIVYNLHYSHDVVILKMLNLLGDGVDVRFSMEWSVKT